MAFNLHKVLRALLFSSSQPLAIKEIQAAFARFHEQDTLLPLVSAEPEARRIEESVAPPLGDVAVPANQATDLPSDEGKLGHPAQAAQPGEEIQAETVAETVSPEDADLYANVPSLITATQIREAMETIAAELRTANDTFLLIEGPAGFRLVTHPRFARWIRILRDEPPPVKLTQSALETLAIVAYRQPVTRTEIETVRGVSAEAGINKLLEREMVYIVGRADLPGRPLQYGTTDKFLDFVGVKSLVELPSSDVLSPRQIDEWLKNAINPKPITDAEMGLPLEEGEGDSPNFEPVTLDHHSPSRTLADSKTDSSPTVTTPLAEDVSVATETQASDEESTHSA